MPGVSPPWWHPERYAARRPLLIRRNRVIAAIREYFAQEGFVEVETPALQVSPGIEPYLNAFTTQIDGARGGKGVLHLHTSPEYAMKKLLVSGEPRIFQLARCYRNAERGPTHHPEFTMLEWYRAEEPYAAVIADTLGLIRGAAAVGARRLSHRGHEADPAAAEERLTLAEAFDRHAGIDLLAFVDAGGATDRDGFAAAAHAAGVSVAADDGWSDIFTRVMAEKIEPALDPARLTVLYEYPAPEAALARRAAHDARVAERFEVYACGVELANGFGELTDAAEQRARWVAAMAEKKRLYGERYPVDEDFLDAVAAMPAASGVALGFDRLVMLCTGASRIGQVIWTPLE